MIVIGSDHGGFELKMEILKYIKDLGYEIKDEGPYELNPSDDFPVYANKVSKEVLKDKNNLGILICRTGIGMSIAANKIKGIMCARVSDEADAIISRQHNNVNVISFAGTKTLDEVKSMLLAFIKTKFLGDERLERRINQIESL